MIVTWGKEREKRGQSKTAWRQAAGEATVGPMLDYAARCEGWATGAPRAQTGEEETVSLRMDWEEAAGLHEETSAAMARAWDGRASRQAAAAAAAATATALVRQQWLLHRPADFATHERACSAR